MRSDTQTSAMRFVALFKFVALSIVPLLAYAAEQTVRRHAGPDEIAWIAWLFLWLFSSAGWAIVHLDALVGWFAPHEGELTLPERIALWRSRLKLIQNYVAAVSAGVAFYLLARFVPSWIGLNFDLPEMIIFVGVVPAAMGGTATWEKIKTKFLGREGAPLGAEEAKP